MNIISCVARFARCVKDNIPCAVLIAFGVLNKKLYDLSLAYHRSPRIPFNNYLLMIALTILIGIFLPELTVCIDDKKQKLIQNLIAFAIILIITTISFSYVLKKLLYKKEKKRKHIVVSKQLRIAFLFFPLVLFFC